MKPKDELKCCCNDLLLKILEQNNQLLMNQYKLTEQNSQLIQINYEQGAQINELLMRLEDEEEPKSSGYLDG